MEFHITKVLRTLISGSQIFSSPRSTWKCNFRTSWVKSEIFPFLLTVDQNPRTQDTYPATESTGVMNHIEHICRKRRQCIDTFVIYLNGPTLKKNGNLLLWDHNADGSNSDTETIKIADLLAPIRRCGAKNYLIIADQNYAGRIIAEVEKGRRKNYRNFRNIHVVTASSSHSYSWRRTFTKAFILYDNVYIDSANETASTRRIADIYRVSAYYYTPFL